MIVERYTRNRKLKLRNVSPSRQSKGDLPYQKPDGNWISVPGEMDWPSFCQSDYSVWGLRYRHTLELDMRSIMLITNVEEIDRFADEWGVKTILNGYSWWGIAWDKLAERYQGIVIAPYIWERRLSLQGKAAKVSNWYYTWDCASGCIWDATAIKYIATDKTNY